MGKRPISRRYDQFTVATFPSWRSSKGADCIGLAQESKDTIYILQAATILASIFTKKR